MTEYKIFELGYDDLKKGLGPRLLTISEIMELRRKVAGERVLLTMIQEDGTKVEVLEGKTNREFNYNWFDMK